MNRNEKQSGKRLYRVKVDPVAREGMLLDEIVIDEFVSPQEALSFFATFEPVLKKNCSDLVVQNNLLAMIESEQFHKGEVHRDAALERVAIFMAKKRD
ncbi:hypothetical protein [Pseudoalteromonas sp. S16_S37]|uniref:hypothetical protein n=1 Tax=Pseudoalteromonas sp. S16_S37 TaxID=2720228 RepID=UPI001934B270|nr:hypothetical protein [Pseudoalteromonas sp. S16_S37]